MVHLQVLERLESLLKHDCIHVTNNSLWDVHEHRVFY